jgi:glutamate formiminotransferase
MRLLTVPNWSFGRSRSLLQAFRDVLEQADVRIHFCEADVDHNRTVTAFSGETSALEETLLRLAELAFDRIDLNRHMGVHPRIGALDVCPFVFPPSVPDPESLPEARAFVERFAERLARSFDLPVFLYERSERGRHEADLPTLRRGGFGALSGRELRPDFGPGLAHSRLGVTVLGVRDFLIACNVNLDDDSPVLARKMAGEIRKLRAAGDERFLGVRALGFPLPSKKQSQVSLNVTLPDLTSADPVVEWVAATAAKASVKVAATELIGVVRRKDLPGSSRLPIRSEQIVD